MPRRIVYLFVLAAGLTFLVAATAAAQDFQKSYQIPAGGSIRVGNISGDVTVTGYDGTAITVTGTKQGPDKDTVTIEDRSTGNNVDIGVRYPHHCDGCNASVQFQIQVPRSISYNFSGIHSISGDVNVTGITGRLEAATVSGTVHVTDIAGSVSAKSVSGDVDVQISRLEGTDDMTFSTVSGSVTARMPAALDGQVEMSSFSGTIDTSFPIEIKEDRFTSGHRASGQIGSGSRRLRMSTMSGNLTLRQL
ncbi:MAG TPA: DUF4097 family beta strand repeat-containing protein [Blastocatellia bacterium]|nr:DUF4097 family beta strand repeat-containing protein [Blastocatellia bacterium]